IRLALRFGIIGRDRLADVREGRVCVCLTDTFLRSASPACCGGTNRRHAPLQGAGMMHPVVVVPEEPELADRGAILVALSSYNVSTGGPYRYAPVAVLVRDQDSDETVGGFWG